MGKRRDNAFLESRMGEEIPVLDHGFVQLVDYMGGDSDIVDAARTSYGEGTRPVSDDEALTRHMLRLDHGSPFEQAIIRLRIKLPISVMRQLGRYRTASYNERSTRYSVVVDEMMKITDDAWRLQSQTNKQGSDKTLNRTQGLGWTHSMNVIYWRIKKLYGEMIEGGIAREQAREILPLSTYTQVVWRIDVRNIMNLFQQRLDSHAQPEIRAYARIMGELVRGWVPLTWQAFVDYRLQAVRLSVQEQAILRDLLGSIDKTDHLRNIVAKHIGNKRERREFWRKIKHINAGWADPLEP